MIRYWLEKFSIQYVGRLLVPKVGLVKIKL
jgi:hypothetical protein